MAHYIANFGDGKMFIPSYRKRYFYESVFKASSEKLARDFSVKKVGFVFFNDVTFIDPKEDYKDVTICLFPRENISSEQYIQSYIIDQYEYLNGFLTKVKNVNVTFLIACYSESSVDNYQTAIANFDFFKTSESPEKINDFKINPILMPAYL